VADFHIRGRIERSGPLNYAAIVLAIPVSEKRPFERMQGVCSTRAQAVVLLHELTIAMGERLREHGDTVLDVRTDD
jgi:hypothetical protein